MSIVLDASVVAAFLLPDENSEWADRVVIRATENGGLVPLIFPAEIRNILLVAERRGRIEEKGLDKDLADFGTLSIYEDTEPNWGDTLALARRHRLTIYDALYLELAARRDASLATLDRALRNAARDEGLLLPD